MCASTSKKKADPCTAGTGSFVSTSKKADPQQRRNRIVRCFGSSSSVFPTSKKKKKKKLIHSSAGTGCVLPPPEKKKLIHAPQEQDRVCPHQKKLIHSSAGTGSCAFFW